MHRTKVSILIVLIFCLSVASSWAQTNARPFYDKLDYTVSALIRELGPPDEIQPLQDDGLFFGFEYNLSTADGINGRATYLFSGPRMIGFEFNMTEPYSKNDDFPGDLYAYLLEQMGKSQAELLVAEGVPQTHIKYDFATFEEIVYNREKDEKTCGLNFVLERERVIVSSCRINGKGVDAAALIPVVKAMETQFTESFNNPVWARRETLNEETGNSSYSFLAADVPYNVAVYGFYRNGVANAFISVVNRTGARGFMRDILVNNHDSSIRSCWKEASENPHIETYGDIGLLDNMP